jgi:hypothetical protein
LWDTKEGQDGRVVAYPALWDTKEGRDGRVIAIPKANPAHLLLADGANVAAVAETAKTDKKLSNLLAIYYWINND